MQKVIMYKSDDGNVYDSEEEAIAADRYWQVLTSAMLLADTLRLHGISGGSSERVGKVLLQFCAKEIICFAEVIKKYDVEIASGVVCAMEIRKLSE